MEYTGYAIQHGFATYLEEHPEVLHHLPDITSDQRKQLVQELDEQELCERAINYFNNDQIYLKEHTLYYENTLRKTTYTMRVEAFSVTLSEKEGNPFLPFLCRIFRKFLICAQKEGE